MSRLGPHSTRLFNQIRQRMIVKETNLVELCRKLMGWTQYKFVYIIDLQVWIKVQACTIDENENRTTNINGPNENNFMLMLSIDVSNINYSYGG